MKLCALVPVRNEDWIIGISLRAALRWCDSAVVLLHACTDRSAEIVAEVAAEYPGRVTVIEESGDQWTEMVHRQWMLQAAREGGATHIALIDADEILTGNILPIIRGLVENLAPMRVMQLPGYNLRGGIEKYHCNGIWGQRWFSVAFADDPRLGWSGDRFHHREPMGGATLTRVGTQHNGGVMHMWGASERRLIARHRYYKCAETLRWPNKSRSEIDRMYNLAIHGQLGDRPKDWHYMVVPDAWWDPYADLAQYLDLDAEPWQEAYCERLIAEHGEERFAGLDLFRAEVAA